jgi:hypothetical protein
MRPSLATACLFLACSTAPSPPPSEPDPLVARCAALAERGGPGFSAFPSPPFAVVGDERPEVVRGRAEHTVAWAVRLLKAEYFEHDPAATIDIWLFKDEASYMANAERLFGEIPDTPFGYYSPTAGALIMNIATGGGTLVHEIVHPYVEANFPDCPVWFNEGLGSLYEACTEDEGRIRGVSNWRLPALQTAIRRGELASFEELTKLTEDAFYGDDSGLYYAQARYLCQYLQDQELLRRYYREFHRTRATDPTGYATLAKILASEDMAAFQSRWEAYVLGLEFR